MKADGFLPEEMSRARMWDVSVGNASFEVDFIVCGLCMFSITTVCLFSPLPEGDTDFF